MAELTDEQIAEEEKWLAGLPRVNWGALFMPGIWGPAHGFWVAILFYLCGCSWITSSSAHTALLSHGP